MLRCLPKPDALERARVEGWYHVPAEAAKKWVKDRWPPQIIAFYQGKPHGDEVFSVRYFADVLRVEKLIRNRIFPDETDHPRAEKAYYRIHLGPQHQLPRPILSRRWRRITFIPTTWRKFQTAVEINDLFDGSPLEDRLWAELKRAEIPAERQEYIRIGKRQYALDFAIYCSKATLAR